MFLPPDQRQPGPRPWEDPPPPRRELTRREETVLTWSADFVVVTMVLAPIGGGTLLEAIWYLLAR